MSIEQDIESIQAGIRAGQFPNEASVSKGIVLRLLAALGWAVFNNDAVAAEYSLGGRRVDYALCSPPGKPIAFIEVKQIGQSDGAERQLFEYAFHTGVPLAILTDGREWNFFLPGEQGSYGERRVYKLDLVERAVGESSERLRRYLLHSAVASGDALRAAREDYQDASKVRQMQDALPKAWSLLISEEDDLLLEIVAERVESLCGFKPDLDTVAAFLKQSAFSAPASIPAAKAQGAPRSALAPQAAPVRQLPAVPSASQPAHQARAAAIPGGQIGFSFEGKFHPARNAMDTLRLVFEALMRKDAGFAARFASLPKHGRSRRYLARDPKELYPGRADLAREHSVELPGGWWASTNHSRATIATIIQMACEVAGVGYGTELAARLS